MQSQHLFRVKIRTRTTSSQATVARTTPHITAPIARILVDTGSTSPIHHHTVQGSSPSLHPAVTETSSHHLFSSSPSETVESLHYCPETSVRNLCCGDAPQVTYVTALSDPFTPLLLSVDPLTGKPYHLSSSVGNLGESSSFLLPPSLFLSPASMMAGGAGSGGGAMNAAGAQQELAAHESQFSLKWNNHTSTFCHVLSALREKDKYSDVTLACEGRFYNVHRLVLGICSDYFDAMLERTPCKHPVIVLKDIKAEDLESLLSYMYIGEVSVSQSDLGRLIKAAELLCIKGLAVPDEPPPGYADAGLAATVVRDKHPGLIYATSEGNVMTFVAHAPQAEQQLQPQPVSEPNFRSSRNNTMPNKKRRKDESVNSSSSSVAMVTTDPLLVAAPGNASSCPSASSGGVLGTTVSVDETGTGALVYHHSSPALQASSPPTSSAALNGRTVGVVGEGLVKEEESVDAEEGGVVASVLAGKSPTISYVVTTDHAGNLHAQPHDPRFETHPEAGGDHSSGDGGGGHQPQPLAEAVAEALAGPSGMQSWLSGGELSQASFSAVETYTGAGGDLTQHGLKAQQQTAGHLPLDGAGGNNSNNSSTTTTSTTVTVAAVAAGSNIVGNASIVGTIIPTATAKRLCINTFTSTSSDAASAAAATSSPASSAATTVSTGVVPSNSSSNQLTCPHCYRNTFRQTSDLKRHIRIHTGEKPYQCNSCPYKASRKDLLHTHCAKIHHYGYTSAKSEPKETNKEEKESGKRKWNANNSENKEWDW
ncbi:BTB/POZ domain [Trinorchestia longiramus]|nr:BTB/POZ domain [Trinorchestia longiramus]